MVPEMRFFPRRDQEHGPCKQKSDAEDDEQRSAEELDRPRIGDHQVRNRRHAEGCYGGEQPVAEDRAESRRKSAPESLGYGPLDAKDIDRSDGRGYEQPNADAGEHQLDAGQDDMRAGRQVPIAACLC